MKPMKAQTIELFDDEPFNLVIETLEDPDRIRREQATAAEARRLESEQQATLFN